MRPQTKKKILMGLMTGGVSILSTATEGPIRSFKTAMGASYGLQFHVSEELAELSIPSPLAFLKSKLDLVLQLKKTKGDKRGITEAYWPNKEKRLEF